MRYGFSARLGQMQGAFSLGMLPKVFELELKQTKHRDQATHPHLNR